MTGPAVLGRYEVIERLGRGGMGVVYRAFDPVLHREVAVKVLSGECLIDSEARNRFNREARALAALQHVNVTTVHEFGQHDGVPFLVMEFLRGCDLGQRLRSQPALTLEQKLAIILDVCAGLSAAHQAGIVHFDIKPANIWIQPDGRAKLLDFGIARVSSTTSIQPGTSMGSPAYMAPEQITDEHGPADHRADLFALGVVAFEMLSGRRPFEAEHTTALMLRVLHQDPARLEDLSPEIPKTLAEAIARALRKNPDERYQNATEFAAALSTSAASRAEDNVYSAAPHQTDSPIYIEPEFDLEEPQRRGVATRLTLIGVIVLVIPTLWLVVWRRDPVPTPAKLSAPLPVLASPRSDAVAVAAPVRVPFRIESEPSGARIVIDGSPTGVTTPGTIEVPVGSALRLTLERPGFRQFETVLTSAHVAAGTLAATLERVMKSTVRIDGPYDFEVWNDRQRLSPDARAHTIVVTAPTFLTLRAPEYLLEQRIHVDAANVTAAVPSLGQLHVQVPGAFERCPAIISRAGSLLRTSQSKHFDEPPTGIVQLVAGQYRIEVVCNGGNRLGALITVVANQQVRVRLTRGSVE